MSQDGPKRIIAQSKPPLVEVTRFDAKPEVGTLLEDTLSIMQVEILRLKKKSSANVAGLNATEATILQGYAKVLVIAQKAVEAEKVRRADEMANMGDPELKKALEDELAAVNKRLGF